MPFDAQGVFTRPNNSFSNPVAGTIIDEGDADLLFDAYDAALTQLRPQEPVSVTGATAVVAATTSVIAIERAAPATTGLTLGPVAARLGLPLVIADWSTAVTAHTITITPDGSETIMHNATLVLNSTASQLSGVTLYPSTDLSGWYIAP